MSSIKKEINELLKFYNELQKDEHGRHKSWEYCYKTFHDAHNSDNVDEKYLDYLSLQLAFYLASWGMYRGSTFLLQKDYKVHKPVIQILLEEEYNPLWAIEVDQYESTEIREKLKDLVKRIKKVYAEIRSDVKEGKNKDRVSDTLITKVLMGTLGCVPAYDRFFISGVRAHNAASGNFNTNSILHLSEFYNASYKEFEEIRNNITDDGLKYPQMKVLDTFFWLAGVNRNEK